MSGKSLPDLAIKPSLTRGFGSLHQINQLIPFPLPVSRICSLKFNAITQFLIGKGDKKFIVYFVQAWS